MSTWAPAAPVTDPSVKIPEGAQVAGMGRRIGAWILDAIFSGLLSVIPMILAFAVGAVAINEQFLDQYNPNAFDPLARVTAPVIDVNVGLLVVVCALYMVMMALYFAGAWVAWGASPGQKVLGLRVLDASSGQRLSTDQALLRWVVLAGAAEAISMVVLVMVLDWMARTPANAWLATGYYGTAASTSLDSAPGYPLLSWGTTLWSIVLLIVTAVDRMKRGWHDKISGSVVLSPIPYMGYPVYPQGVPAYPPQAYPPQAYPPQAYPPQAYPPQGTPGWPPQQAPGYPPSAYPGYPPSAYPGYPGYPPQGQPSAPDTPPPAPPADAPTDKPAGS